MPVLWEPGSTVSATVVDNNTDVVDAFLVAPTGRARYLVTGIHVQLVTGGVGTGVNISLMINNVERYIWTATGPNFLLDISGELWMADGGLTVAIQADSDPDRTVTQLAITATLVL